MIVVEQDITKVTEGIVVQQVNCQGVMNGGLAKQFKLLYPNIETSYQVYLAKYFDKAFGTAKGIKLSDSLLMLLVFGQFNFGTDKRYTDYEAVIKAFQMFRAYLIDNPSTVYFPYKFGCGLGGGNWKIMQEIIRENLDDVCKVIICKHEV